MIDFAAMHDQSVDRESAIEVDLLLEVAEQAAARKEMEIRDFGADKLRKLIADYLEIDVGRVADEANLSDDLGVDWFDQIDLLAMIEDEFEGVEFCDVNAIEIVGDLIRHVEMARPIAVAHRR